MDYYKEEEQLFNIGDELYAVTKGRIEAIKEKRQLLKEYEEVLNKKLNLLDHHIF